MTLLRRPIIYFVLFFLGSMTGQAFSRSQNSEVSDKAQATGSTAETGSSKTEATEMKDANEGVGDSIEGIIASSGSHLNYRVVINEPGGKKSHILCAGEISDSINNYSRLTAKIKVKKTKNCLEPESFTLTKTPSGIEPIIGELVKEGDLFMVAIKDQKYVLEHTPKRLQEFLNKKVVLDLAKSITNIGREKNQYTVMYFAIAP